MLDIKFLRANPDVVKENIKKKFQDQKLPLVDEAIELDIKIRDVKVEGDTLRTRRNAASGEIGKLMREKKVEEANQIKEEVRNINDTLGYEQGDAQIKAAANVLIKTQLDNTDIMRTDGNEYLIYLVGYQEKQVVSYIRKLYKEFKNLPYEHGAAIGYSMITNDMKTIEDSINESVEDMRIKKEEIEEVKDDKEK